MVEIIWQDSLSIIVEYVGMVNLIRDKREEHKYTYKVFEYNNTSYSMFFSQYRYLFNINLDYLEVPLIPILIRKMIDKGRIYNNYKYE